MLIYSICPNAWNLMIGQAIEDAEPIIVTHDSKFRPIPLFVPLFTQSDWYTRVKTGIISNRLIIHDMDLQYKKRRHWSKNFK